MGRTKTPLVFVLIHSRGRNFRSLAVAIQFNLAPTLKKEYSYTSTLCLVNYGLLYFESYLCQREE
jgi:hypothetical protein